MLPTELSQSTYQRILLQRLQHRSVKVKNKTVFKRNYCVLTPDILAWKSEERPLSHCKIGAESDSNNQPGPLVR